MLASGAAGLYTSPMKAIFCFFAAASVWLCLTACESDVPPAQDAGNKLERGLTGGGTLVQPDRSNDPIIREQSRVGN